MEDLRQTLTELNEDYSRKISWQKSFMICIKILELILACGSSGFCIAILVIATNVLESDAVKVKHYLIGVLCISILQILIASFGIGSILVHHIYTYAAYCILTLGLLLSFLSMTIFLYIEIDTFIDSVTSLLSTSNSHNLGQINDAFSCSEFNSTAVPFDTTDLSQCASDWMHLYLTVLLAIETTQIVFLSLVLLLSCLLHKSMVEDSAVMLPHNMRWLRRRFYQDEVILLDPNHWSRDYNETDNSDNNDGSENSLERGEGCQSDDGYSVRPSAPPPPSYDYGYIFERTHAFVQDLIARGSF
ncbi:PREDICTED: uncharacterized protein LOC109582060 isoform X2 [Amphimedon queenslandica]|uniref:Uncharacterized protein n=1 Tax=Amphimedon queenslandica TaxID=400682 RepID=A0AAN0J5A2_AMPQE|nr:PREDICTED: uncharacterized protein LOC109582060 isoform X2 [Amphimedon queenslandica]|eukprot:XP_019852190.1 PREDICTED: uncharacterized protein LOC109582060 isoform X2 [Amphimedon queenslandica]